MRWSHVAPTEEQELKVIAEWLDLHGLLWCHVPNEGQHKVQYRVKQMAMGVKPGVPDILIFTPPRAGTYVGTAIELKRADKSNRPTKRQKEWLVKLSELGWYTAVCYGADEAIRLLEKLGYRRGGSSEKDCDRNRSHTVSELQRANQDCQRGT